MTEQKNLYNYSCYFGEGKYRIHGMLSYTHKGIIVQLLGGELPHVGTIILSQPRTSMENHENTSTTTSMLNLPGHKDDIVAKPVAEKFSRELNQVAVVISGIHVDSATEEDIKILMCNSEKVAQKLLQKAKKVLF